MGAQILSELLLVASTPNRDRTESHVPRKLHTQMTKAANALHSNQVSGSQSGITKGVIRCDPRAKKRSGFSRTEFVRNGRDPARFVNHHFRVTAIQYNPRGHQV